MVSFFQGGTVVTCIFFPVFSAQIFLFVDKKTTSVVTSPYYNVSIHSILSSRLYFFFNHLFFTSSSHVNEMILSVKCLCIKFMSVYSFQECRYSIVSELFTDMYVSMVCFICLSRQQYFLQKINRT